MNKILNMNEMTVATPKKISFVLPIYNEAPHLQSFIEELMRFTDTLPYDIELIAVNDGSKDNSAEVLESLQETYSQIKIINFSRNFGKEPALIAGLEHSQGEACILMDSDHQHPISTIESFLTEWENGYAVVYGQRNNRDTDGFIYRHAAKWFYRIIRSMTQMDIPANAGDFRLLDRKVVKAILNCPEKSLFMKGLYAWAGFKTIGVPYDVAPRRSGSSHWASGALFELAITGITAFSTIPLRIWALVGFGISFLSFGYACIQIVETLCFGADVPGYATIIVAIMFFGGIQLMSVGILGEYIARIFNEVKNRPRYIIEKTSGFEPNE